MKRPHFFKEIATYYFRVFFPVAVLNILIFALVEIFLQPGVYTSSVAVTTYLLPTVVTRNEYFVNSLFVLFVDKSTHLPLSIRRQFGRVYCYYGAIHRASASAALIWYVALIIKLYQKDSATSMRILSSCFVLSSMVLIILFALPFMRRLHHNCFERVHRYCAWALLLIFWMQLMLAVREDALLSHSNFWKLFLSDVRVWEVSLITGFVIFPWLHLRKRVVECRRLSSHALVLNFGHRIVSFGQAIRVTDSPLRETHAFAVIPNIRSSIAGLSEEEKKVWHVDQKGFSIIISRAGDWSGRIIDNPPSRIWTRGLPQFGTVRVVKLFRPCIVMATGSGIGPCLSLFVEQPSHPVKIVWSARAPLETYGSAIMTTIRRMDPTAIIHDTQKLGRPDLVQVARNLWEHGSFEAVVFISNMKATREVTRGLEKNGIRAYGVIFDS
ncbi:hypothetical protein FOL46_008227 [Perkinsus olseni]|uniref:Integral membrane protein TmpA n=1 Tax=Perkinsus olseni TaxID=32597 RepID=A0A7J6MNF1_PEROL|nr:hypothetical protein FOL46_008227 [Perkinsus olseni]